MGYGNGVKEKLVRSMDAKFSFWVIAYEIRGITFYVRPIFRNTWENVQL